MVAINLTWLEWEGVYGLAKKWDMEGLMQIILNTLEGKFEQKEAAEDAAWQFHFAVRFPHPQWCKMAIETLLFREGSLSEHDIDLLGSKVAAAVANIREVVARNHLSIEEHGIDHPLIASKFDVLSVSSSKFA
jgi:hypothetical protein